MTQTWTLAMVGRSGRKPSSWSQQPSVFYSHFEISLFQPKTPATFREPKSWDFRDLAENRGWRQKLALRGQNLEDNFLWFLFWIKIDKQTSRDILGLNPPPWIKPPLVRYIFWTRGGGLIQKWPAAGRKILGVFGSVLIDFPLKNSKKTCQMSAKSPKFFRLRRANTKQR